MLVNLICALQHAAMITLRELCNNYFIYLTSISLVLSRKRQQCHSQSIVSSISLVLIIIGLMVRFLSSSDFYPLFARCVSILFRWLRIDCNYCDIWFAGDSVFRMTSTLVMPMSICRFQSSNLYHAQPRCYQNTEYIRIYFQTMQSFFNLR